MGNDFDSTEDDGFGEIDKASRKYELFAKHRIEIKDKLSPIMKELTETEGMCRDRGDRPDFARRIIEAKLSLQQLLETFEEEEQEQAMYRRDNF